MHLNLDEILAKLTDWDLKITIGGKTIDIAPPDLAAKALFAGIASKSVIPQDVVPQLQAAIANVVSDATVDVKNWNLPQLLGVATAILNHEVQSLRKNSLGIAAAVKTAMQPTVAPVAPAAPIKLAPINPVPANSPSSQEASQTSARQPKASGDSTAV